jgi:hypothetical protein
VTDPVVSEADYVPNDAARLCACSVDTIRRYRRDGRFPNAYRDSAEPNAAWRIPLGDLVTAGLYTPLTEAPHHSSASAPLDEVSPEPAPGDTSTAERLLRDAQDQIAWLRDQNQRLFDLLARFSVPAPSAAPLRSLDEGTAA